MLKAHEKEANARPAIWRKSFEVALKAEAPNDVTLALVRLYAVGEVKPEEVAVWKMALCNTDYDRADERFPVEYLQRFAETLPGKSLMPGHDYSETPIGRFISAEVMPRADGGFELATRFYTRAGASISDDLRLGIAKDGSIGFIPDDRICDICGQSYDRWYSAREGEDYCHHIQGREYDGRICTLTYGGDITQVEAVEGSLVWLGCQYGAQTTAAAPAPFATKAAHIEKMTATGGGTREEDLMEIKEAEAKIAALETKAKELETKGKALEPLVRDGELYREWQKKEIARLYAGLKDEATGATLLKALANATAAELEEVRAAVDAKHAQHFAGRPDADVDAPEAKAETRSVDEILYGARARRGGE